MKNPLRKLIALAATAAISASMIPAALAGTTNNFVMIDDVQINKSMSTLSGASMPSDLRSAINALEGSYNDANNMFTVKKLPSSMPYMRPKDYYSNYTDALNYAPYMPLDVGVSFYYDGKYVDLNKVDGIWVDGNAYKMDQIVKSLERSMVMDAMLGEGYDTTLGRNGAASDYKGAFTELGAVSQVVFWAADAGTQSKMMANPAVLPEIDAKIKALLLANVDARSVRREIISLLMNSTIVKDLTRGNIANDSAIEVIEDTVAGIADAWYNAFVKYPNRTDDERIQYADNAMMDYAIRIANDTNRKQGELVTLDLTPDPVRYGKIHVFHDLRVNPNSHEIRIRYKGVERVRSFQVNSAYERPYSVAQATRIPGVNYENMLASAENGNLFIEFSMRDLLATDTWGSSSSAYRLWDRSNFTLSGTWISFKSTVLSGDTVFFNTNVALRNADRTAIPAGTELTLTYGKYQSDGTLRAESSWQYSNTTRVRVKNDGSFDFEIALDKNDMSWIFNGHYQRYVNVSFADKDGKYTGNFDIAFSARNRVATPVTFAQGEIIKMKVGEVRNINAVLNSSAMSTRINTFVSSMPSVATIEKTGDLTATVRAMKIGTTVVTATTANGEYGQIIVDVVDDTPTPKPTPVSDVIKFKVVTASSNLNVRSGPSTAYKKVGSLKKGATFYGEIYGNGSWIKLNYNGKTAYVSAQYALALQ